MSLCQYGVVMATFTINHLLGMDTFLSQFQTIYILMIMTPLFAFSFLSRPADNSIMKVHVVSPKYIRRLESTLITIKMSILKTIIAAILLIIIKIVYLYISLVHLNQEQAQQNIFHIDLQFDQLFFAA